MNSYLLPLETLFLQKADAARAAGAKAYLLNQFEFYGIPMAERRKLCRVFLKSNPLPSITQVEKMVKEAWQLPQREWQYFAIELLSFYRREWKVSTVKIMEYGLTHKSWWDTVDTIADAWVGEYCKLFPAQMVPITSAWNASANIWLQRTSLLFQKKYKQATNTALLQQYVLSLAGEEEFFIRKAIGWILREYAKTNPAWVKAFVNANKLSPLSRREALKHLQ